MSRDRVVQLWYPRRPRPPWHGAIVVLLDGDVDLSPSSTARWQNHAVPVAWHGHRLDVPPSSLRDPILETRLVPGLTSTVVICTAAKYAGVAVDAAMGSRAPRAVMARTVACWAARELTGESDKAVAAAFGLDSHATIIAAVRRCRKAIKAGDREYIELAARVVGRLLLEHDMERGEAELREAESWA